ncbi:uncharacterized protein LOC117568375 isoform X2 [Drosophila albomicans]|uniref:Uncharacterized protein LOC117568375 isoform X2 n=1 Tax=Drosophila albomicans TaxID=7291 RepID=A0A6P8WMF0_DROAB|nr:uncharacterized protein LOC117568375 isoform X2 [Drosophila albomicans]XP_034104871.1 uncharacterized protein LOC117568375 isoform X2 [Drosophila albomicans]
MAPKKSTIVLNVEQFIHDIEERPAIWNRNFHCNKAFLEQMWDELSGTHKLPKIVLKAKWKGLRDNFRVEYKRIPRADNGDFMVDPATFESKWLHYYALLFLTDHMRHRLPKNEQDQSYYFNQQSEDCEKTVVEPDLTNGLIRRLQDSDEDYDEDDIDGDAGDAGGDVSDGSLDGMPTPPAAHQQTQLSTTPLATGALKAQEEAFAASHQHALLKAGLLRAQLMELELEKEAQDLSTKSTQVAPPIATPAALLQLPVDLELHAAPSLCSPPPVVTTTTTHSALTTAAQLAGTVLAPATTTSSTSSSVGGSGGSGAMGGKRSVSPPPLYNKAHHPLPTVTVGHHSASAAAKDDFTGGAVSGGNEHLNFTQHSYANGLIPALKLKRPRLSEDSNFNGSSTMDVPLVPEDDDYHYLLSLHPYMKQLTAAQKLRIRTKIQKLIFKELYKEDLEESK